MLDSNVAVKDQTSQASSALVHYDAKALTFDEAMASVSNAEHTGVWYPECPGVYVFDGIEGVLYVGESSNIRQRFKTHERGYLRRTIGVRCLVVPCLNHKQVEKWLIDALKPSMNGQRLFRPRQRVYLAQLTEADVRYNVARLRKEAEAKLKHADALEIWMQNKFGDTA
jgi:hypothetical protein